MLYPYMPKYDTIFFWKGAHAYHRLAYHLVFTPKYRKRILQGTVQTRIRQLFLECCKINDWFIHEMEIMPDHVHILIQLPATIPISQAAQYLKGGSSRVLRQEFPELEEFLWGDSFWQDGYFAETNGRIDEKKLRNYIKNQRAQRSGRSSPGL